MENNKKSPQYLRTDKAITNALIHLLREKPFEKITVQDILDETPVTRATFYAHFKDKYDIAEHMQKEYLRLQAELIRKLAFEKRSNYPSVIQRALNGNRELVESLSKIHTDSVDLQNAIASEHELKYLSSRSGSSCKTEARVYAQAMTAFQLSCMHGDGKEHFSTDYINQVMVEVFLYILQIDHDKARRFLYNEIRKAENKI